MQPPTDTLKQLAQTRTATNRKAESLLNVPRALSAAGLDIALFGIPYDGGTIAGRGSAAGPAQMRHHSYNIASANVATQVSPMRLARFRDIGDAPVHVFDPVRSYELIEEYCRGVVQTGALPLAAGGDHSISLPMLRAVAARHGPVAVVHFDAHPDTFDEAYGNRYNHATPFRRSVEEGLEDAVRHVIIGVRGTTAADPEHFRWARQQGMTLLGMDECADLGAAGIVQLCREKIGNRPVYVTLDVDGLDPAYMPGTGWPEPGGLSIHDVQRIIRGLRGLPVVGADVVEVLPAMDPSGRTALSAAHLMFEILCVMAEGLAATRALVR